MNQIRQSKQTMNYPGDKDIICGNLKLFTDHLGNRRFQMLVHLYQTHSLISKEHSPRRTEALVKEIMRVLQQSGYRFLKFHKNGELASVKPLGVMKVVSARQGTLVKTFATM